MLHQHHKIFLKYSGKICPVFTRIGAIGAPLLHISAAWHYRKKATIFRINFVINWYRAWFSINIQIKQIELEQSKKLWHRVQSLRENGFREQGFKKQGFMVQGFRKQGFRISKCTIG